MSDIGLRWDGVSAADFSLFENDLEQDDGLETAVLLSLFTDRRAADGDVLPDGSDRRGYWADELSEDQIGSRLWLLDRSKQTVDVLARTNDYVREALAWMVEDHVADQIDIDVTFPARGIRLIKVTIHRPDKDSIHFRFNTNWAAQAEREHP